MIYLVFGGAVVLVFLYLKFARISRGLPVLMYHKVTDHETEDYLTVSPTRLEKQFQYIRKKNFNTIFLSELLDYTRFGTPLPPNPLLLTFDDGYKNNYTHLYPLLHRYALKANIFLVAGFINTEYGSRVSANETFLHIDDIRSMSPGSVQFGLHTYDHKSYRELTITQVEEDIIRTRQRLGELKIPFQPCLAYAYGAFPRGDAQKTNAFFQVLSANGIELAFRIGNRINKLPIKNRMLVQRIDVRGTDSFLKFRLSLAFGLKILFK
jgi:peptidoglycan/xylan/chitin deacetylase (PgdA/CDA1 family)